MELNWNRVLELAATANPLPDNVEKMDLTQAQWSERLSEPQFAVLRGGGTQAPFSSNMCSLFEPGLYLCAGCGTKLFDSSVKFESGTGWPSFGEPISDYCIAYLADHSHAMTRIEVQCAVCDGHLGHVFPDGPPPTRLRYCINAISLCKASVENATKFS